MTERLQIDGTEARIVSLVNEAGWMIRQHRDGVNFELYEITPMDDERLMGIFGDLMTAIETGRSLT